MTSFWLFIVKNDKNVLSKSNIQKNLLKKVSFLLASGRSMMKIAGSGSVSIGQSHGSPDPDPHQDVMDPQHCYGLNSNLCSNPNIIKLSNHTRFFRQADPRKEESTVRRHQEWRLFGKSTVKVVPAPVPVFLYSFKMSNMVTYGTQISRL